MVKHIIRIPVTGSPRPALIDRWNFTLVSPFSWSLDAHGYAHAYCGRRHGRSDYITMHRLILGFPVGTVDHEDRDPLNNRERNLRLATKGEQMFNMGLPVTNTSGFKGITHRGNRWLAYISFQNRKRYVGSYRTPEEAAEAYDEAALRLFGDFACTNQMLGLL